MVTTYNAEFLPVAGSPLTGNSSPPGAEPATPLTAEYALSITEPGTYTHLFQAQDNANDALLDRGYRQRWALQYSKMPPLLADNYCESVDGLSGVDDDSAAFENQLGYSARSNGAGTAAEILANLPKDEIMFFSGHGYEYYLLGDIATGGVTASDGPIFACNDPDHQLEGLNLNKLLLAVWFGCKTAHTDSTGLQHGNLTSETRKDGAKCAVGFEKNIKVDMAVTWYTAFWKAITGGSGVKEATKTALMAVTTLTGDPNDDHGYGSCDVEGDQGAKIVRVFSN